MPLVTKAVPLGAVSLGGLPTTAPGTLPPHTGSLVVGGAAWSDGSLSTYATVHNISLDGYAGSDCAYATFGPVVPSADSVREVTVTATTSADAAGVDVSAFISGALGPAGGPFTYAEFVASTTTATATAAPDTLEVAAMWLAQGGVVGFARDDFGGSATCYELTITVTYWTGQPPRRIFPRDDGLTGGAPRNYPPSKGVQSGNRAAGGYV